MAQVKVNIQRLTAIRKRQAVDHWGKDYVAAIFATPKEAPGISRPSILVPEKLGGRDMHLLSLPEKAAGLLALHDPNTWEIQEEKVLSTGPRPHFLFGHPRAQGIHWPSLKGTVDVANRMGRLKKHPKVKFQNPKTGEWQWIPFPYIGDLLLFRQDELGVFCVNWTVKDKYKDFKKRGPRAANALPQGDSVEDDDERHELEKQYYADAEIRTVQVAGEAINKHVVANLAELFLHHGRRVALDTAERRRITDGFVESIGTSPPIFEHIQKLSQLFAVDAQVVQTVLRQGIWRREIRVDLYQPLLRDQPLKPEIKDVLEQYSAWFIRSAS